MRSATRLPIWAKLSPNTGDVAAVARACEDAGADALVVANTILGLAIDLATLRPALGAGMGGYSGPGFKPIALRLVWQCAQAVRIPVIGCGGIATGQDAVEFLAAGVTAVQVGTASFVLRTAPIVRDATRTVAIADALPRPHGMPSGAGHDAAEFARHGVPAAMVFVRNRNGSHNPAEAMEVGDLMAGVEALWGAIRATA